MHKPILTREQKSIIVGKILGDGHLETQTKGKSYRLKVEHSISQKEYVDWTFQMLKDWVKTSPKTKLKMRQGIKGINYYFQTVSTSSFRFFGQSFYPKGVKQVPIIIGKLLTPLSLAIWFMDDGSIKSRHHRALILNTQAFNELSLKRLQKVLDEKFGVCTILRRQKEGKQIYVLAKSVDKFVEIIKPYLLPEMYYKLGKNLELTQLPKR